MSKVAFLPLAALLLLAGCKTPQNTSGHGWPRHRLQAAQITSLNLPNGQQFDASGLWLLDTGELLTLRNSRDSLLYRIEFLPGGKEASLKPYGECFSSNSLRAAAGDLKGFDCEGIARDAQGRFYICEERRRAIFRCDPPTGRVEKLPIVWGTAAEYFSPVEPNASFEGIAVGKGHFGNQVVGGIGTEGAEVAADHKALQPRNRTHQRRVDGVVMGIERLGVFWLREEGCEFVHEVGC